MKKLLLIPTTFIFAVTVLSQDVFFEVRGLYTRSIKKEQLAKAQSLADIIPDYPINWIDEYVSVEVSALNDGKKISASNSNEMLNTQQKTILGYADISSDINIHVLFKSKNTLTRESVKNDLHISFTVIPEKQAGFVGGELAMNKYFLSKGIDKLEGKIPSRINPVVIQFTINEQGKVSASRIDQTSGYEKMDRILLQMINAMPKWKPAQDENGNKIEQNFQFNLGRPMGGC